MPNSKVLEEKKAIVAELADKMKNAKSGVLVDYKGITVDLDTKLRKSLREAGVEYSVVKNTLTLLAAKQAGFDALEPELNGTTAIAISLTDEVAPAKIIGSFIKDNNDIIKFKAGFVDGRVADLNEIKALSELPSKEVLIAKVLCCLNSNIRGLAVALNAIKEKKEAEAE